MSDTIQTKQGRSTYVTLTDGHTWDQYAILPSATGTMCIGYIGTNGETLAASESAVITQNVATTIKSLVTTVPEHTVKIALLPSVACYYNFGTASDGVTITIAPNTSEPLSFEANKSYEV